MVLGKYSGDKEVLRNLVVHGVPTLVALICLEVFLPATLASQVAKRPKCQPAGRVLRSTSSRFPPGKIICREDLRANSNGLTEFLCFVDRQVINLPKGWVARNKCAFPSKQLRLCSAESRVHCPKPKGGLAGGPILIRPFGSTLIDGRPLLAWSTVKRATSYIVEAKGEGVYWQKTVENTSLPYPSDQPSLDFGKAYQITILANQGNNPLSSGRFAVNLLPEKEVVQINELVQRTKNLQLPPDERTYLDLDSLYISTDLLNATIEALEARVKAGSRSPEIHRTLGDRYLDAGLPTSAKQHYERAAQLAQEFANPVEYQKAKTRLQQIAAYSQEPTKRKLAQ